MTQLLGALAQKVAQSRLAEIGVREASKAREVAHQAPERPNLLLDDLERRVEERAKARIVTPVFLVTLLNGQLDRCQRIFDLVGEALGHFLPGADALQVLDTRARLLHLAEHPVEGAGKLGELVGSGDRDPYFQIAGRDLVDGVRKTANTTCDPAREQETDGDRTRAHDPEKKRERFE